MQTVTPEEVGFSSARLARIGSYMQACGERGQFAGSVTLLARHGRIAHFEATGMLDCEAAVPMSLDAIFRIYSMTKPVAVTATLMLFEEGRFLLDDPIADYLPEFGAARVFAGEDAGTIHAVPLERPITIRHLLTHRSGLPYANVLGHPVERLYAREDPGGPLSSSADSLAACAAHLARLPLVHQPGAAFTYGMSHDVLGRLVEVLSGQTFDAFLQQRIFDPLGMVDTGFYVPAGQLDRLAPVYRPDAGQGLTRLLKDAWLDRSQPPAIPFGGHGLVSTAADYARFCQMLLNGGELDGVRLLGRKTIELMTADQGPAQGQFAPDFHAGPGHSMGLGVAVLVSLAESGRPGSPGAFNWAGRDGTFFWIDPHEDLFGVFMVQTYPPSWRPANIFQVLAYQALTGM